MVGDLLLVGHLGVGLFFCFNGVGRLVLLLVGGLWGCCRGIGVLGLDGRCSVDACWLLVIL